MSEHAMGFLREHGANSLVSLGCGHRLNRLENHLRLMLGCGVRYYVGIDRIADVQFTLEDAFSENGAASSLLSVFNAQNGHTFDMNVRMFPGTHVEDLAGIHCALVVCQRVLPFRHWERVIESMQPMLVLQEDLNGCELQKLDGGLYIRTRAGVCHYRLTPFRPYGIFPRERNLILWRRRDFFPSLERIEPWWVRFYRKVTTGTSPIKA